MVDFRIERAVGGRCYDVDTDGGECHWGTVLVLEPRFAVPANGDLAVGLDGRRRPFVQCERR